MAAARVLVVDDEIDTLNLLKTILQISGFDPITTLNSVTAIDLAEAEKPDVVLLDIMMPKLDGFTLCKLMRQNTSTHDLPIIFVTAYEALDIEDRRREAGANLVIQKPIGVDLLINSINKLLTPRAAAPAVPTKAAASGPAEKPAAAPSEVKPGDGTGPATPPQPPAAPGVPGAPSAPATPGAPRPD